MRITLFLLLSFSSFHVKAQVLDFQAHFEGTCQSAEIHGEYAYFNSGPNINILDISNLEDIHLVNSFHTGNSFPVDINYSKRCLYICSGVKGFLIYDVSDPTQPSFQSWVDWPSYESIIQDSIIIINEWLISKIAIFSISDVTNPVFLSRIDFPVNNNGAYALKKNILYGFEVSANTNWDYYIRSYNISDPSNPQHQCDLKLGEWPMLYPNDMATYEENLLVAFEDTIKIFDISSIDTIVYSNNFTLPIPVNKMKVKGDTMLVYSEGEGILFVNISDIANPDIIGEYNQYNLINKVKNYNNLLLTSLGYKGLEIINVEDLSNPSLLFEYKQTDNVQSIEIQGNIAYMGMDENGLQLVDISSPLNPVDLGNVSSVKRVEKQEYFSGHLYCRVDDEYDKIHIIDVQDSLSPVKVNEMNSNIFAWDYKIQNNMLYLAGGDWIKLYDLTKPAAPEEVESYNIECYRIAVEDNLIVTTQSSTLKTFKITSNKSLICCDSIALGDYFVYNPRELNIKFPYVHIGASSGVGIFELDDDYQISFCDELTLGGWSSSTHAMSYDDNYIYLGGWYGGSDQIVVIDINDPYDLWVRQSIHRYCLDFGIKQKMIFTAESQNGYSIYGDIPVNIRYPLWYQEQLELITFPNPFSNYLKIEFGDLNPNNTTLNIYSINGQLIAEYDVSWKKKIKINTENYGNGIYVLEIINNLQKKSSKVMKLN